MVWGSSFEPQTANWFVLATAVRTQTTLTVKGRAHAIFGIMQWLMLVDGLHHCTCHCMHNMTCYGEHAHT
jgi:hypothetical protein